MPKYRIQVAVEYSGNEYYEIEANSEEEAIELAKLGECNTPDQDLSCDKTHWEEVIVDVIDK